MSDDDKDGSLPNPDPDLMKLERRTGLDEGDKKPDEDDSLRLNE